MYKIIFSVALFITVSATGFSQNVGVNTLTPQSKLDVNGDLALRAGTITLTSFANDNIDIATTPYSFYNVSAIGFRNIGGFNGGKDGRLVTLHNGSNFPYTLLHNAATSLATNQIEIPGGTSLSLLSGGTVTMMYNKTTFKWNIVSSNYTAGQDVGQWSTTGNNNTVAGSNFIGTIDSADLVIKTANIENIRVTKSGNIGIGTATPSQKLTVQTATNQYGIVQTDGNTTVGTFADATSGQFGTYSNHPVGFFTNNKAQQMTLLQNGNVGIGTTTPYQKLIVQTATNNYGMVHTDGTNSIGTLVDNVAGKFGTLTNVPLQLFTWGQAPKFTLLQNGNVGIGTTTPVTDLQINPNGAGSILIGANKNTGGYTTLEMGINAQSNGNSYLQSTKASGSTWGDLMINQYGGQVGIGTAALGANTKLTVKGTGTNYSGISATANGAAPFAAIAAHGTNGADALLINGPIRVQNTDVRVAYRMTTQTTSPLADGYLYDGFGPIIGQADGHISIRIENSLCNGDPDAIILYSFLGFFENAANHGSKVEYNAESQRWFIKYDYDKYSGPHANNISFGINILIIKQ